MKNKIIFNGIYLALIGILSFLIMYAIDFKIMMNFAVTICIILLQIAALVFFALQIKKENNGYITFSKLFEHLFLISLVGVILTMLFNYIFNTFIDPSLQEKLNIEILSKQIKAIREKISDPKLQEEKIKMIKGFFSNSKNAIMQYVIQFFGYIILYTIFDLIISAIFKKNTNNQ